MKLIAVDKVFRKAPYSPQVILKNFNLTINMPEFLAVTGPSGSGKSTLLNLIGLLERPDNGSIMADGQDLTKLPIGKRDAWRRENLGFIFQFHHLLPEMTALENIALVLRLKGASRADAELQSLSQLEELGLGKSAYKFPAQLSGGEQQRVAVARAVIGRPKLILADEPTGNLDHENAQIVFKTLQNCVKNYGISVVMVTHNQELAARADREISLT